MSPWLGWRGHGAGTRPRGCPRSRLCPGAAWGRSAVLTQRLCALSADDCKNIANIMKTLAHRGFIFKQTSKPF